MSTKKNTKLSDVDFINAEKFTIIRIICKRRSNQPKNQAYEAVPENPKQAV